MNGLSFRDGDGLNRALLPWLAGYLGWPPDCVDALCPASARAAFEGRLAFQFDAVLRRALTEGGGGGSPAMHHAELEAYAARFG